MKKSEKLHIAMLAMIDATDFSAVRKLEVLECLMQEKRMAEMIEEYEKESNT